MADPSFFLRERFHLLALRQLAARLTGRAWAVKGGICLRLFHGSERLSEDMDLDVASSVRADTLRRAVDGALAGRAFAAALEAAGLAATSVTRSKQTETTQRWKVLLVTGSGERLHTKLDFSRRRARVAGTAGAPDPRLLLTHGLPPFVARHYDAAALAGQKLAALAAPTRHAVRDLYDIWHLLAGGRTTPEALGAVDREVLAEAIRKIKAFTRRDFEAQVRPYMDPGADGGTGREPAFQALVDAVLASLARVPA